MSHLAIESEVEEYEAKFCQAILASFIFVSKRQVCRKRIRARGQLTPMKHLSIAFKEAVTQNYSFCGNCLLNEQALH